MLKQTLVIKAFHTIFIDNIMVFL